MREPDFIIGDKSAPYLRRWFLIPRNKWLNIYLHQFLRSDDDRALHDHPWVNLSVLLRGEYLEVSPTGEKVRRASNVKFRRATSRHRILLNKGECWTLFITGPRFREWGFWCPQGFVAWQKFTAPSDKGKVGAGCDQ